MSQTDLVIPVRDALEYTKKCVESVLLHTPLLNRIIFVDDNSAPETRDYLLGLIDSNPSWLYIRTGSQRWFTRASNLGLRMVRTQKSVLLNSDCVVDQGWLEELHSVWDDAASRGLRVGLVGSVLAAEEPRRWAEIVAPGYVTGHALLLNISALQEVSEKRGMGGWYFDETKNRTIHIFSDNELCEILNNTGWKTIASFKSLVGHEAGKSWGHRLDLLHGLKISNQLTGEVTRN